MTSRRFFKMPVQFRRMVMTHVKYLMREELKEHRHEVSLIFLEQKKASISLRSEHVSRILFLTPSINSINVISISAIDRRCSHPLTIFSLQTQQKPK